MYINIFLHVHIPLEATVPITIPGVDDTPFPTICTATSSMSELPEVAEIVIPALAKRSSGREALLCRLTALKPSYAEPRKVSIKLLDSLASTQRETNSNINLRRQF